MWGAVRADGYGRVRDGTEVACPFFGLFVLFATGVLIKVLSDGGGIYLNTADEGSAGSN